MKKVVISFISLFIITVFASAQVILQENFTSYNGTAATVPAGWYFSYNGNYSSASYSGNSGPNSYKFGTDSATIVTPAFSNADSVYFWIKGAGTDNISALHIFESPDSSTWTNIATINSITTSGGTYGYAVQNTSTYLKFVYTKSLGNLAFDDFLLVKATPPPPNPSDTAIAHGKIKIYFNMPVDTNVSTGINANYLNGTMMDTLIAYLNRAKYSIDITQYNYVSSTYTDAIATAINNAYSRGVKIRWIYNGGSSNSGLSLINSNINTLGSPTSASYGLMHDKFVIIDAKSSNPKDAVVITGSTDWNDYQFLDDYNNLVVFQDSTLADAYTKEFNQMWGDTGLTPNLTNSKFGPDKSIVSAQNFIIGGVPIELQFSPQGPTDIRIINSINTANTDLYFGVYTFTQANIANAIVTVMQNGVYTAGIMDQYSLPFTAYSILDTAMGNMLQIYADSNYIYHNKMAIIDPSNINSDPQVITGSYNWTSSAQNDNDENTVIIHSAIAANMYYQAFYQNFTDIGGNIHPLAITQYKNEASYNFYPNPFHQNINIRFQVKKAARVSLSIYNVLGQKVANLLNDKIELKGIYHFIFKGKNAGIYIIKLQIGNKEFVKKAVKY